LSSTHTYGYLGKDSVFIEKENNSGGDEDEEENESTEGTYAQFYLQIVDGKWILLQ